MDIGDHRIIMTKLNEVHVDISIDDRIQRKETFCCPNCKHSCLYTNGVQKNTERGFFNVESFAERNMGTFIEQHYVYGCPNCKMLFHSFMPIPSI